MTLVVRSEDLLFGAIPGGQPHAEFTRAFLSFDGKNNAGEPQQVTKELVVGLVLMELNHTGNYI